MDTATGKVTPSPSPFGRGVSRRYRRLSLKRCRPGSGNQGVILPLRVRTRGEIFTRTRHLAGYAARIGEQSPMMKGPGEDSPGGVTIRPMPACQAPFPAEAPGESPLSSPAADIRLPRRGCMGAWWHRLDTTVDGITGERPTSSPAHPGVTHAYKPPAKWRAYATVKETPSRRAFFRDCSASGR